ncbi:hypothetical protein SAMN05892877_13533 [Rhizobium subbaraonis]|uniref:Uncharacterized protein n=3 Tax=Hyphomicrobiales TaxID=356 RepID=A0A285V678_9HYPH|nr:hypothetical protein EV666_12518 [Camelimonas lactis]SOC48021.1 hypothetical protein SAMN05892877_13533 [Rhizobium subbaraonis]
MTIPMKLRGKAAAMIDREQLRAALARMETSLAETRRNLALAERALSDRAEAETIGRRPKARYYHRRMSRWTGADEVEYRRVLDGFLLVSGPDMDRLRLRIERQEAAIEALRRKYGVNAQRPGCFDW